MRVPGNQEATPVAIYARYSTDKQDARSIDDQLRKCRALASDRGHVVVAEFKDAAQSGAHMERVDMRRMVEAAKQPKGSSFKAIIVDDLSRLSRDLGNTWELVFGEFAGCGVRVIDASTGMASDGAGARLTFGAMALVNDTFLQLVKAETHRGLEGRALGGFWTGGRVFGYSTEPEKNPSDPEHPRAVPVINTAEAEIVRRIFQLSAGGVGHKAIASRLNTEGLPAPYDRDYSKRAGKGWGQSTIAALLRNERYIGKWVWNKRKWVSASGKKTKRAIMRPQSEWVSREIPELAIVTPELWEAVQTRRAERPKQSKGRAHGEAKHPHPLSGFVRCGSCGSTMNVVSARVKNGRRYSNFGCAAHLSKGKAACGNRLIVSELKLMTAVFDTIREMLSNPTFAVEFIAGFNERIVDREKEDNGAAAAEKELRTIKRRIQNLTDGLAAMGWSPALGEKLKAEEEKLRIARSRFEQVSADNAFSRTLPSEEKLQAHFRELTRLTTKAPVQGKAALEGWFGPVTLTPREEGGIRFYEAKGSIKLDPVILANDRVLSRSSCGGPQRPKVVPLAFSRPKFVPVGGGDLGCAPSC